MSDTIPMIFIAEARPATEHDTVRFRLADESAVRVVEGAIRPHFDFGAMPSHEVQYPDLFTPDGRIPPRVTPARRRILAKMRYDRNLGDAAKPYWVKRARGGIVAWRGEAPRGDESPVWVERRMLTGGIAFRGTRRSSPRGYDVYKGENVVAGEIYGKPALQNVDVAAADDASIWRYVGDGSSGRPNLVPPRAFAVAAVAHCPNLCPFDPRTTAFTNTVQIFVPRDEYGDFPFDLLCLSNVYVYWFVLLGRMGLLRTQRSHIYPTNFALLPWSDQIARAGGEIEAMRGEIVAACRAYFATGLERAEALTALQLATVKARGRADPSIDLTFSASFDVADFTVEAAPGEARYQDGEWFLPISPSFFDYISTNNERIARGVQRALNVISGETVGRKDLLNLPVPYSDEEARAWDAIVARFDEAVVSAAMNSALAKLDVIIGAAVGLDAADLREIEADMKRDPFLSHVRPRYPGAAVRIQGLRGALDSSARYA